MRIVVGSGSSRDVKEVELDRHLEILVEFIGRVEARADEPRELTMILRLASSGPAQALILKARDLARAGIAAKVIVAHLDPEDDVRKLYACLSQLKPRARAHELFRWARNPWLLDAHEQVTYGSWLCWWGDSMRRDADKRNALSLVEDAAAGTLRLGHLAFKALWSASAIVTERRLVGPATGKPFGAYERSLRTTWLRSLRFVKPPWLAADPALATQ
jgi:hypothetical protein